MEPRNVFCRTSVEIGGDNLYLHLRHYLAREESLEGSPNGRPSFRFHCLHLINSTASIFDPLLIKILQPTMGIRYLGLEGHRSSHCIQLTCGRTTAPPIDLSFALEIATRDFLL
ncbi:hypothetical protein V5O48_016557 [Marasmius crinis-equi]|uniref:Uncharacterized protein n=1 Tax=Marasmius crinis-equi TaxID=585013 RepID=A0ABR3ERP1_9AGAR